MSILHKDNNGVIRDYTGGSTQYSFNYTTDEVDTGIKWIDGRTVYRKTISLGALPSSATTKQVAHDISNLDRVINFYGFARTDDGVNISLNHSSYSNIASYVYINPTYVNIQTFTGRSQFTTSYITIEYVKTIN